MPTIQEIVASYQGAIQAIDEQAISYLIGAYQRAYGTLRAEQDALLMEIDAMRARGETVTRAQLRKLERYRTLIRDTERIMQDYGDDIGRMVLDDAPGAMRLGEQMAYDLLVESVPPEIRPALLGTFQRLPQESVEALVAALRRESPLWTQTLATFGQEAAQGVADGLTKAVIAGWNPVRTASHMANAWGMPLTRAMTIARTEHLRAHRMATLAGFRANSNIVKGWVWNAALDRRTCLSCVNLHGTRFSLEETFDDHPNGRCFPTPDTVSWKDLGYDVPDTDYNAQPGDGERWFRDLTADEQRQMMGNARYRAWRDGEFDFSQLTREVNDADWGRTFVEASLKWLREGA